MCHSRRKKDHEDEVPAKPAATGGPSKVEPPTALLSPAGPDGELEKITKGNVTPKQHVRGEIVFSGKGSPSSSSQKGKAVAPDSIAGACVHDAARVV